MQLVPRGGEGLPSGSKQDYEDGRNIGKIFSYTFIIQLTDATEKLLYFILSQKNTSGVPLLQLGNGDEEKELSAAGGVASVDWRILMPCGLHC